MLRMNQTPLPLPNPGDWLTTDGAAHLLGVHRRTLMRMVDIGQLTAYEPGAGFKKTPPLMFWRPAVEALRDARLRAVSPAQRRAGAHT